MPARAHDEAPGYEGGLADLRRIFFSLMGVDLKTYVLIILIFGDADDLGMQSRGRSAGIDLGFDIANIEIGKRAPLLPADHGFFFFLGLGRFFWGFAHMAHAMVGKESLVGLNKGLGAYQHPSLFEGIGADLIRGLPHNYFSA